MDYNGLEKDQKAFKWTRKGPKGIELFKLIWTRKGPKDVK